MSGLIQLVNLSLSLLAFALIAKWYIVPRLREVPTARALEPLLLLHSFRHIGLMFLADGAVKSSLPTAFAQPAAWGDLAASVLAFVALLGVRRDWSAALPPRMGLQRGWDIGPDKRCRTRSAPRRRGRDGRDLLDPVDPRASALGDPRAGVRSFGSCVARSEGSSKLSLGGLEGEREKRRDYASGSTVSQRVTRSCSSISSRAARVGLLLPIVSR